MGPFATYTDVQDRWRPLTQAEQDLATVLIADASDMIRARWSDMDARLEVGTTQAITLVRVVSSMVRRALMNRGSEGVEKYETTAGPFGQNATFVNPDGNLYFTAQEVADLSGPSVGSHVGWLV